MTKLEALNEILAKARIRSETGRKVSSFQTDGFERAHDYLTINQDDLFRLMSASYDAGAKSK